MKAYVDLGVKVAIEFGADEEQARRDMEDILDLETNLVNVCKQYHLHVHVYTVVHFYLKIQRYKNYRIVTFWKKSLLVTVCEILEANSCKVCLLYKFRVRHFRKYGIWYRKKFYYIKHIVCMNKIHVLSKDKSSYPSVRDAFGVWEAKVRRKHKIYFFLPSFPSKRIDIYKCEYIFLD